MNARILTATALVTVLCGALPARAADPQLLNLVMPDVKAIAGINVDQAKTTPFGQYVLSQVTGPKQQNLQNLVNLTGFDPTKDVSELLLATDTVGATTTPGTHQGLVLARGTFDPAKITAAATAGGALTESYGGVTIVENPKQQGGFAFLSASYVVAGDIANVKAAIDRQKSPASLPAALATKIGTWSANEDAWVISTVPPSTLKPPATAPTIPGLGANGGTAFQNIVDFAAGVKFGASVVATVQAEADNAQDATSISGVLQLLASVAKMQAAQNAQLAALANAVAVTTDGSLVNVTFTLPEDQLQQLLKQPRPAARHPRGAKQM
jgi:hypothetical protein